MGKKKDIPKNKPARSIMKVYVIWEKLIFRVLIGYLIWTKIKINKNNKDHNLQKIQNNN